MVGFAGETEEEFNESLSFAKEIGFAKAHIFAYSRRAGTVAYSLPRQVTNAEKSRRSSLMIEATRKSEEKFLSAQLEKTQEVLFETYQDGVAEGYTANYSRVAVKSAENLSGEIRNVKLLSYENEVCYGELI